MVLYLLRKFPKQPKASLDDIDKKKMQLANPIRELGTTLVPIKLHTQVTAELKVVVKEA